MRRHSACLFVFLALVSLPLRAADAIPAGWFVWPMVEPADGTALDTRALNAQPAGTLGRVTVRDGRFVTADGARIRFWGTNLSSGEAFLDAATADRVARRLAKAGVNVVRLHHLDNPWSVASRGSLWSPDDPRRLVIDPQQLDQLHRLVAALKAQGIYSNVNLKVSRTFSAADGFPDTVAQLPQFQKRVDYFDRRMIDLHKDYARQLLSAKNPYTGLSLADDPAVAVIELNNENSLLGMRTRDIGRDLDKLPEPFRADLATKWNAWLAKKYPGPAALAAAWSLGATPPGRSALTPDSRWHADAQPGNEVAISDAADPSAVHLAVKSSDGIRWRSAAFLDRLTLADDATYTLTFSARADTARPVIVALGRDEPGWRTDKWRTLGLVQTIALTPEWTDFRFVINTHSIVDLGARFSVIAGHRTGQVWLKNLRLESGSPTAGLRPGQSPAAGNLPIPTDATPAQWHDWLAFLADTELAYVDELRACLRDELHVRAPIVCTQANYGGIAGLLRERPSEFIDAHSYWQHPDFGGLTGAWNLAQWTINNSPEIAEFGPRWFGELGGLALLRVAGKPFSATELDHPATSEYACEFYPVLATFAAVQDWDALYTFDCVALGAEPDSGELRTFFDQSHHPAKWSFSPFAARAFRLGLVPPAAATRELHVRAPIWREANHTDVLWLRLQPGADLGFLSSRLRVNENLLAPDSPSRVDRQDSPVPSAARVAATERGPVYAVSAPQAAALVGYLGGGEFAAPDLALACDAFGLNFASVTAVSLDARPLAASRRTLVTLAARAGNQGAVWNSARTSVGAAWGHGPTIAEHIPATLRLRTAARRVFALAPDGTRAAEIPATAADGWLTFSTRTGPPTLHYEVLAD